MSCWENYFFGTDKDLKNEADYFNFIEKYISLKNELSRIMEAEIDKLLIESNQDDLIRMTFKFDKNMEITFDKKLKKIVSIISSKKTEINIRRDLFNGILAEYFN